MKTLFIIVLAAYLLPSLAWGQYIVYHPASDSFDTGKIRRDVPNALVDGYVVLEVLPGTRPTPSATESVVEVNAPCVSDYPTLTCTKQWTVQAKPQEQLDLEACRTLNQTRRDQARGAIVDLNSRIGNLTNGNALAAVNRVMINQRQIIRILFGDPDENC